MALAPGSSTTDCAALPPARARGGCAPGETGVIRVRGARTHNLKNVDLDLPRGKLVVITGLSGSGKSSLAFDTLYAEGQRRYVESLSAYARQFLQLMAKPDVDLIEGLSPAIAIEQRSASHNPRSTVGTITEIHDYLRLLFARTGEPHCPDHQVALAAKTVSQMVDAVLALPPETRVMILAPVVVDRKGEQTELFEDLRAQGFVRARVDGEVVEIDPPPVLGKSRKHTIEVVVDRLRARPEARQRLAESFETALRLSDSRAIVAVGEPGDELRELAFSARFACPVCNYSLPELEPRLFSFNNPMGACPRCEGLGSVSFFDPKRVVAFPDLSLAAGAVKGWDRRNQFYYQMLASLAEHFRFDVEAPFERLSAAARDLLLYGSGREKVRFAYPGERGRRLVREHPFEGIIPNLERRWRETDSAVVREELGAYRTTAPCPECQGTRLRREARHVYVGGRSIHELGAMPLRGAAAFFQALPVQGARFAVSERIVREISARLEFLVDVGLDYLCLDRGADTLSGGESQRIRLASQIGSGLTGVLYVLDEPSIGLHQRDNNRLLATLERLRDLGNSVIVVEHDRDAIELADHVVDMGPGAGEHGGQVVAQGTPAEVAASPISLTGQFLCGRRAVAVPALRHPPQQERWLRLRGARGNNLRGVDLHLPVGLFTCVTGVSGSGKSTLVNDTLGRAMARALHGAADEAAPFEALEGAELFDKLVVVDQSPIGRTPRSNPATYTGLFTPIRELFAGVPLARERGYGPGRFSFNVRGGRCEACQGDGALRVEMHFLPDVYVPCDVCHGRRYNRETLEVLYKGHSVHDVLALTVEQARELFAPVPAIARKLDTLLEVGLGYVTLGQSATTLSGGEAQRVKLSLELSRRDTGRTLYILDEPTTGLHFHDVELLLGVLHRLRDHGNTVVVIEHNLDVIKTADWLVDLGPEGGDGGGQVVAAGTPEAVTLTPGSHTGEELRRLLARSASARAA
ncbi:MAG: excinuclease ABC subunit UvrA [Betaproteobacteria bacterium]|jgi:excinuclease ABC subunit A|nr:excinuclease ABC subunit UvrA [Rhodocyclaceae bacterium]MCA3135328.1 excinuclease ABC subunit UvrA [Rhodocyclaceae bacterium]MCA3140763.1 excinuclease ABC subunit UvrA [Rhodocyclaceae bacterium]MCA3146296.1 excinuclease ABC subunit UvrA [Rhodocyclaceae bacterium]MCE2898874.1 excinuclease ABC subunit UvrA [Betaproteobacteria bacterium]